MIGRAYYVKMAPTTMPEVLISTIKVHAKLGRASTGVMHNACIRVVRAYCAELNEEKGSFFSRGVSGKAIFL